MINILFAQLERAGIRLDPLNVAEALWLSGFVQASPELAGEVGQNPDIVSSQIPLGAGVTANPQPQDVGREQGESHEQNDAAHSANSDPHIYAEQAVEVKTKTAPASAIRVPAASALPHSLDLSRALRPLNVRRQSSRYFSLDEEGTVEMAARQRNLLTPKFCPRLERRFEAVLVVEQSPSMSLWEQAATELYRLLTCQGAFNDVRMWRLHPNEGAFIYAPGRRLSYPLPPGLGQNSIVFFLTNGLSPNWRNGGFGTMLAGWGRTSPIVVVHALPHDLWIRTLLGPPSATVRSQKPGQPNGALLTTSDVARGTRFVAPVMHWTVEEFRTWSRMFMAHGNATAPALLLRTSAIASERTSSQSPTPPPKPSVEQRLNALDHSSPEAQELATYLAAAPLTLPVIRLVQAALFEDRARPSQIAEVMLSGLVRRVTPEDRLVHPDTIQYRFDPEVVPRLLERLRKSGAVSLVGLLTPYIRDHQGNVVDFRALVRNASGRFELPESAQPFAELVVGLARTVHLLPNSARPKVEPNKWVRVSGTGRFDTPSVVQWAAKMAGAAVAKARMGMITGGWQGVDNIAGYEFAQEIARAGLDVERWLLHIVAGRDMADLRLGREEFYDWGGGIKESIRRSTTLIVIGGEGGTWETFQAAIELRCSVIPVANSGGDAQRAWRLLRFVGGADDLKVPRLELDGTALAYESALIAFDHDLNVKLQLETGLGAAVSELVSVVLPSCAKYLSEPEMERFEAIAEGVRDIMQKWPQLPPEMVRTLLHENEWRLAGYFAFQMHAHPECVIDVVNELVLERREIETHRETRPLFQLLNCLYLCVTRAELRERLPNNLQDSLKAMRAWLDGVNYADVGGECKRMIDSVIGRLSAASPAPVLTPKAAEERDASSTHIETPSLRDSVVPQVESAQRPQALRMKVRSKWTIGRLDSGNSQNNQAAIVFVHGFTGDWKGTWGRIPDFLSKDQRLNGWDLFGFGYESRRRFDLLRLWSADPALPEIATALYTTLESEVPPAKYKAIALVAHSMGGLVVQEAIVQHADLRLRTNTLVLFGTPSAGLAKADKLSFIKDQTENMRDNSSFIRNLRAQWAQLSLDTDPRLRFVAVAGEMDQFVPPASSLGPFVKAVRAWFPVIM